jgi:hypothetical protein
VINILQHIIIREVTGFFGQVKVLTLDEIQTTLTPISQNFILDMTKAYLELLDQAIVEDKKRRSKKGVVIDRRDDKRDVYLQFGHLSFKRTYSLNKRDEDYAYLLDQAVGLEGYPRFQYCGGKPKCFTSMPLKTMFPSRMAAKQWYP